MAALIDCNCNSPTCDCCVNKPTTVQTATTTLVTPTYFNDKSYSGLTDEEISAKIDIPLDVSATLTLFNANIINNAVFYKTDFPFVQERIAQGPISLKQNIENFLKITITRLTPQPQKALLQQQSKTIQESIWNTSITF